MLSELHESKEPILIKEHLQPAVYLVDVEDYEMMQVRFASFEGLAKREAAFSEGRLLAIHKPSKE